MFDDIANATFKLWGLHGTSLIATLIVLSMICQLVARLIPEDATGWKGVVRSVAKVVGLYASNRITMGITTADVAKAAVHSGAVSVESIQQTRAEVPPEPVVTHEPKGEQSTQESSQEPPPLELRQEDRVVTPAFPGYQRPRDEHGNFLPLEGDSP